MDKLLWGENIYGHVKRLQWIKSLIKHDDLILEFGCGTGYMITIPLLKMGYNVIGVDLDEASIEYGKSICKSEGVDPSALRCCNIKDIDFTPNVIIASEVFEHVEDKELESVFDVLKRKLRTEGNLLVTVPNGYGSFEFESCLWYRFGIGEMLEKCKITLLIHKIKSLIFGKSIVPFYPSTLSSSPHVQRFTYGRIKRILLRQGFTIEEITGTVLFAGPFSDLIFTGLKPIMKFNCFMGKCLPWLASGFLLNCKINVKFR